MPQQQWGQQHQWGQPQQQQQRRQQGGDFCSNTRKQNMNLFYCFTCGYDVNHKGHQCPRPKPNHIPGVPRDKAHLCPGASMKAQHKALTNRTGQGKGWLIAQAANKGFYTMGAQGQQPWVSLYNKPGRGKRNLPRRNGGRGGRGGGG